MNEKTDKQSYPVYYLSNFKKYTRKLYGFGELKLPRPIKIKVFIIFIVAFAIALIMLLVEFVNLFIF